MPRLKNVEKKIKDTEGFGVKFLKDGKDVHGDKNGIPQYRYRNAAPSDMTVNEWKKKRFAKSYSGFEVEVLDYDGDSVSGQTKLVTVRDTYYE